MPRTPRKIERLLLATALFASIVLLTAPYSRSDDSKAGDKKSPLDGAWKMVTQKNGDEQDYKTLPEGLEQIDHIVGGRFVWTLVQNGKVVAAAGGRYKVDKDTFSEIIDYTLGDGLESFVGKTFEFTAKLDGDTWHKVGTIKVNDQDYKIDEKWERCK
jgi:hypothetical protein